MPLAQAIDRPARASTDDPLDVRRDHEGQPHKPLTERLVQQGRAQQPGQADGPPPGRRPQAALPDHRLEARQARRAGARSRRSSTTRTARRASRLLHYADGEKRYILAAAWAWGSATRSSPARTPRRASATPCRCATCRSAPRSTTSSCIAGPRRPDRAQRRQQRAADGQGGRVCATSACPRARCAACASTAWRRSAGRQPRAREPAARQGRPRAPHGPAARGARLGDEPARPSARRWRGQVADRHAAEDAVGQAGDGPCAPAHEEASGQDDRPPSVWARLGERDESVPSRRDRSSTPRLLGRIDEMNKRNEQQGAEDLVARRA